MNPNNPCYYCGHDHSEHRAAKCFGQNAIITGPDNMDIEAHECDCRGFIRDDIDLHAPTTPEDDRSKLKVYVLWWRYSDGSGTGIARVYSDKSRAEDVLALLIESNDREWKIDEVQVDGPKE